MDVIDVQVPFEAYESTAWHQRRPVQDNGQGYRTTDERIIGKAGLQGQN